MQHDLVLRAAARSDGVVTIHLAGVIDAHTLDRFENGLDKAMKAGAKSLVLDCEELRYVNSSGFGELIRYFDRLREKGGTLVLTRVAPKVAIILEMLGLRSLIPITAGLDEAMKVAAKGAPAEDAAPNAPVALAAPPAAPGSGNGGSRISTPTPTPAPGSDRLADNRVRVAKAVVTADKRTVVCAFCDTRLRIGGEGRWACPSCGAPFTATREGGVAFDWSRADSEAIHLTFDVSPRTLAAFAGMLEGILVERRVSHARMRRFAREAAHVCHLLAEHALEAKRNGPLHVLALAGPQRLHLRVVDRGKSLGEDMPRIFATQSRLFLDFKYTTQDTGFNVTEFAFAYAGSGVFVT